MINKANIIGWLITIFISVFGSYQAITARVYEVEARIRLIEVQQSAQSATVEKLTLSLEEIQKSLYRIESTLQMKQDKKYIQ